MTKWYHVYKRVAQPIFWALWRPRLVGEENIPASGGAVLAPNHISAGDTFLLPTNIKRQVVFAAKKELFAPSRNPRRRALAWFLRTGGMVPIDRLGGRAATAGLEPVLKVLRDGGMVGIFPEGTRSPDGRLYKGHTGVARLAASAGVPVVPVGNVHTQFVRGRFGIPTIRRPLIVVGPPLRFDEIGSSPNGEQLRWMTDEIMAAIQRLTGQEYVDVYSTRVKYGDLKDADLSDRVKERPGGGPAPEQP